MSEGPDSGRPSRGRALVRLAITLAAPLVVVSLGWIPIPGIDVELLRSMGASPSAATSVVSLGIVPFITASILVELACLITRRGRRLRISGPEGRRRMWRATAIVALVVSAGQAIGVSTYLSSAGLYFAPGALAHCVTTATLAAGTSLLALIALAVSRYGLGNGFSALIAGGAALELADAARGVVARCAVDDVGPLAVLIFAACVAAVSFATVRAARRGSAEAGSARQAGGFRDPASGALPVAEAAAVLTALAMLAGWGIPGLDRVAAILTPDKTAGLAFAAGVGVGLAVLFSFLFHQPLRVAALSARVRGPATTLSLETERARGLLFGAAWRSSVYVAALLAAGFVAASALRGAVALDTVGIAIITAVVLDVRAEWSAWRRADSWVPVWPEHRVYAADAALEALSAAGIDALARAVHHRTLLQLFGPYVPIEILVPRGRADEARRILAAFLPAEPAAEG
jgi:preprotein translocase subunit SecY